MFEVRIRLGRSRVGYGRVVQSKVRGIDLRGHEERDIDFDRCNDEFVDVDLMCVFTLHQVVGVGLIWGHIHVSQNLLERSFECG